jgi:hypothetical protein
MARKSGITVQNHNKAYDTGSTTVNNSTNTSSNTTSISSRTYNANENDCDLVNVNNMIDISESPEKSNSTDQDITYYDILEDNECPFNSIYTTSWITAKYSSLMQLCECTLQDSAFIRRVCHNDNRPIKFNSLITCVNQSLQSLLVPKMFINDEVVNSMMKILNYKHSVHEYSRNVFFYK